MKNRILFTHLSPNLNVRYAEDVCIFCGLSTVYLLIICFNRAETFYHLRFLIET